MEFDLESSEDYDLNSESESIECMINVGGKKFSINIKILEKMGIIIDKLPKFESKKNGKIAFLDKDPFYFKKSVEIFHIIEKNSNIDITDFSDQLISELIEYKIIDVKFTPIPKIKLQKIVSLPDIIGKKIKIIIQDYQFEILSETLSKSDFFMKQINENNKLELHDTNPKIFRYVLNLLRNGELFHINNEIMDLLIKYDIDIIKIKDNKNTETIVSHYIYHDPNLNKSKINSLISNISKQNLLSNLYDPEYYLPNNNGLYINCENYNIVHTQDKLLFDSNLHFNLINNQNNTCIDDLLFSIDIPIINPIEKYKYVDNLAYNIIEEISVYVIDNIKQTKILYTNNDLIYLHPLLYKNNSAGYHEILESCNNKVKVLYNNNLIDIHRITLPLFLLSDCKNHIPLYKIGKKIIIEVKIGSLKNLFIDQIKNIPLLNACIITNNITLSNISPLSINDNKIVYASYNTKLIKTEISYLYILSHIEKILIKSSINELYNIVEIPLKKFNLIKDLFFTFTNNDNIFHDYLIEFEIVDYFNNIYTKIDTLFMNKYIPLKKLKKSLPNGIFYYTFSANPLKNKMLGALEGEKFILRIKTIKTNCMLNLYINEYVYYNF